MNEEILLKQEYYCFEYKGKAVPGAEKCYLLIADDFNNNPVPQMSYHFYNKQNTPTVDMFLTTTNLHSLNIYINRKEIDHLLKYIFDFNLKEIFQENFIIKRYVEIRTLKESSTNIDLEKRFDFIEKKEFISRLAGKDQYCTILK